MKTLCLAVLFAFCASPAFAHKKPTPTYQDGVLKSYRAVNSGSHCAGTASNYDDTNANVDMNCHATGKVHYFVVVGSQTFELAPAETKKKVGWAMATFGYSSFFEKDSVLYGQLPNTPVKIRTDGQGKFWVKLGKRESLYRLVGVR